MLSIENGPSSFKSYTSLQRQQQILSDLSLIIKLISCYKKNQKQTHSNVKSHTIKPSQAASSFSLIKQSSAFSQNPSSLSSHNISKIDPTYKQYGKQFNDLSYSDLLYLLCRKKADYEFIKEFLCEKYNDKKLENMHYKMVENFMAVIKGKQPQISLVQCLDQEWGQILSKEDVFEDVIELLGQNISKNWKANNLKLQKQLQKSIIQQQQSKIFQTQPTLQHITITPLTTNHPQQHRKKAIEQSTRHILTNLEQLKKQMSECQAEMNMAKNNQEKVIQKSKQYSVKMREYNQLKEVYRKRMGEKRNDKKQKQEKKVNRVRSDSSVNNLRNTDEPIERSNQLSKINEEGSEYLDNTNNQNDQPQQGPTTKNNFNEQTPISPKKVNLQKVISSDLAQNRQKITKYAQDTELSVSMVLNEDPTISKSDTNGKSSISHHKIGESLYSDHDDNKLLLSKNNSPLTPQECDQLMSVLETVRKNEVKERRIKTLTYEKDSTPFERLKSYKQHLSINVDNISQPHIQQPQPGQNPHIHSSPQQISLNKSLISTSPKQILLQTYIRKVFNHFVLQQSKLKFTHLFDSSLSGSELGSGSFFSKDGLGLINHKKILSSDVSPHMRKKFSTQVSQHDNQTANSRNNYDLLQQRRRKSLAYPNQRQQYNTSRKLSSHPNNRTRTLTNSISLKKSQPHLTIESYSKFIRSFSLCSQTVTFQQIISLFKQKSQNKKTITFDQFVDLFQDIYKLECQKLQIYFTPILFDAFLRKEIFDWDKINNLLRIKTMGNNTDKGGERYGQSNDSKPMSSYKCSLTGHSGMLKEDIVDKINASKKPFDKMPCMVKNTNAQNHKFKTLPTNITTEQLPQTKIQQKVEKIKRLRELQKAKKAYELQEYLQEARQKDSAFMTIKDELREKASDSYAVRFKNLQSKRREVQEKKKSRIYGKNSIINESKLRKELIIDTIEQDEVQQQDNRHVRKNNLSSKQQRQDMSQEMRQMYGDYQIEKKNRQKTKQSHNKMKTLEESFLLNLNQRNQSLSHDRRSNSIHVDQGKKGNTQQQKQREDIMELEKIIGLRESEDEYEDDYQNQIDEHMGQEINKYHSNSQYASQNYSQVAHNPMSKLSTVNHPPVTLIQNRKSLPSQQKHSEKTKQVPQTEIAKIPAKPKPKQLQEDEYLLSYLKKQSQLNALNTIQNSEGTLQRDWLKNNDRQNWRVHF